MKNYFSKLWKLTLSSILAVTGFSACSVDEDGGENIKLMYGTMNIDINIYVKGKVVDVEGQPVNNARVIVKGVYSDERVSEDKIVRYFTDTTYSDKEGIYDLESNQLTILDGCKVICEDSEDGFKADSVTFVPKKPETEINFTLKKK